MEYLDRQTDSNIHQKLFSSFDFLSPQSQFKFLTLLKFRSRICRHSLHIYIYERNGSDKKPYGDKITRFHKSMFSALETIPRTLFSSNSQKGTSSHMHLPCLCIYTPIFIYRLHRAGTLCKV